jgi:hypothetical protein
VMITWALQCQPAQGQPWHTHSLNVDTADYLTLDGHDPDDPQKLAQQLAERMDIHADTAELIDRRGPMRIAVWLGEDSGREPDGAYGSLDVLGVVAAG